MAEKAKKSGEKKKVKTYKYKYYEIGDEKLKRSRKFCPKCGAGVFMAQHKDRLSCGKCGYSESTIVKK
ncbi:MAG: 30S ribosomal protein S27ae [Candidatus Diapherotrites archaeon]|nr:30S ribosomal protein S27ae [Candidatus Diapherotrites archaeon]